MPVSPQKVYDNLSLLEQVDVTQSAIYRQQALDLLADTNISLRWRRAIADRLNLANHQLTLASHCTEDSY
jgi:hypothetical protein